MIRQSSFKGQRLGHAWPRLHDTAHAESLASLLLQVSRWWKDSHASFEQWESDFFDTVAFLIWQSRRVHREGFLRSKLSDTDTSGRIHDMDTDTSNRIDDIDTDTDTSGRIQSKHHVRVILIQKIWFIQLRHGFMLFHFVHRYRNTFCFCCRTTPSAVRNFLVPPKWLKLGHFSQF